MTFRRSVRGPCHIAMLCYGTKSSPFQLVSGAPETLEQLTLNQRVHGSSPCAPTIENNWLAGYRNI
jgi:hypothetical protein